MRKSILYIVIIGILASSTVAYAGWFGSNNYDECILENMKGTQSDKAAIIIMRSCLKQFPTKSKKIPESRFLLQKETWKLAGEAGWGFGNSFSVTLYNGNGNVKVTEVIILLWIEKSELDIVLPWVEEQTFTNPLELKATFLKNPLGHTEVMSIFHPLKQKSLASILL